jgi:hypothetical protein
MAMLAPENGAYNMPSVLPTTVVLHPDVMVERLKQQQVTIPGQRYEPLPTWKLTHRLDEADSAAPENSPTKRHPQSSDWAVAPRPSVEGPSTHTPN